MTAYMVILAEISDPAAFRCYALKAAELITVFGGEYIVRGTGESECLEGDWPDTARLVISKWPSMATARAFWQSEAYAEIRKLRQGNATVRVRLIEGIEDL